jgi:hypothetical protein
MEPEGSLPCSQEPFTGLCPDSDQSNPYHPILSLLRLILLLSTHLCFSLPSDLFLLDFSPISYMQSFSTPCYMPCPSHSLWLDHSNYTWPRVQVMKLLITQFSPASRHFSLLSRTLFSNTSVYVSHPFKITRKIIVLYIANFTFFDRRREDKRFWTEWYQPLPEFNLLSISSWIKCWSVTIVHKYQKELLSGYWSVRNGRQSWPEHWKKRNEIM